MENQPEIETNILSCLTLKLENKSEIHCDESVLLGCLQCEETFDFPKLKDEYLAHLYLRHRLVIADEEDIANLRSYLEYWKKSFENHELEEFCTTLLLDQLPDGTPAKNEKYYLLSDILPKDYELRKQLQNERLEKVVAQHQFERTDRNFTHECLYCRNVIKGLRSEFLEHLFSKHFLQLGKPENLVFIDELINVVQNKLENLICLYCEKIFKDRVTLKEHMRKKGHKRINPDIKFYDKFFLINYKTEKPKHSKNISNDKQQNKIVLRRKYDKSKICNDDENPTSSNSDRHNLLNSGDEDESDWSDWDGEKQSLKCLFCPIIDIEFINIKMHMKEIHNIDLDKELVALTFYQKIKVINYIRRQMHILHCVTCNQRFGNFEDLQKHLVDEEHYGIGDKKQWDQPEFFFPTFEDDGILCHLDDMNDNESDSEVIILAEENKGTINKDAENLSLENFVL